MKPFELILGEFRGNPNDYMLKKRNNKLIICTRIKSKPPATDAQLRAQQKFKIVMLISSAINRNEILKKIWKKKGGLNKIVKENYDQIAPGSSHYNPRITPDLGFLNVDCKIIYNQGILKVQGELLEDYINPEVEKSFIAAGIIIFRNSLIEGDNNIKVIDVKSGILPICSKNLIDIEIRLTGEAKTISMSYKSCLVFLTLVTLNK